VTTLSAPNTENSEWHGTTAKNSRLAGGNPFARGGTDVSPPNPVAGILFKSDAGKFFDELLDKFDDHCIDHWQERSSAVQSREEFDRVVEMAYLRRVLAVHD
jgi:hypothetical protein